MSVDRCCVLFTKPAVPGRVKTRLIGALTPAEAAELHQAFLDDILSVLSGESFDVRIAWALGEEEPLPTGDVRGLRQRGVDLGARLYNGLTQVSREYGAVLALGSDHPEIPVNRLDRAFDLLETGSDVVVGPASDGGYYLIGLRRSAIHPQLFEGIVWSSELVLSATLERCDRLGLDVALLPEGDDVDSPDDLERLVDFLAHRDHLCPRTAHLLQSWGRLP